MKKNKQRTISGITKSKSMYLLIIIVLFPTFPAQAAETEEMQPNSFLRSTTIFGVPLLANDENLSVGLGVGFSTNPYKGVDDEADPFPELTYQNGNFVIDLGGVGYTVFSQDNCAITLLGSLRSAPYESDDSTFLNGMEKRDLAVEGGVAAAMETFLGDFEIMAMSDVTNKHQGQFVTVQHSISFGDDSWSISPVAGVTWQTKKMIDYYYGVRRSEVRNDRAFYEGKSTFTPFLGLNGGMKIYDNLFLQGGVNCEFLGDGITDSPLIEDDYVLSGSLSISYSF